MLGAHILHHRHPSQPRKNARHPWQLFNWETGCFLVDINFYLLSGIFTIQKNIHSIWTLVGLQVQQLQPKIQGWAMPSFAGLGKFGKQGGFRIHAVIMCLFQRQSCREIAPMDCLPVLWQQLWREPHSCLFYPTCHTFTYLLVASPTLSQPIFVSEINKWGKVC